MLTVVPTAGCAEAFAEAERHVAIEPEGRAEVPLVPGTRKFPVTSCVPLGSHRPPLIHIAVHYAGDAFGVGSGDDVAASVQGADGNVLARRPHFDLC